MSLKERLSSWKDRWNQFKEVLRKAPMGTKPSSSKAGNPFIVRLKKGKPVKGPEGLRKDKVREWLQKRLSSARQFFYQRSIFNRRKGRTFFLVITRKQLAVAAGAMVLIIILGFSLLSLIGRSRQEPNKIPEDPIKQPAVVEEDTEKSLKAAAAKVRDTASEQEEKEEPPKVSGKELPVLDLQGYTVDLETEMLRINEPTPWGREILYSAGNSSTIDEPVFTELFLYNLDTKKEERIAGTDIKFGEIYEGSFNDQWIVWLDTNQQGTNYIYAYNRGTKEKITVKKCDLNKPQLALFGNNLVWVEQKDVEQDRLYLYNFQSGEPVSLESFSDTTYGICPPAINNDVVVWVYPHPDDPKNKSIIKKLDLRKALTVPLEGGYVDPYTQTYVESAEREGQEEEGVEPEIIDPQGFAMYPATNGTVIAWLDHLDPAQANLKMTIDGKEIITVATGVGRLFGVGDHFIVYTQNQKIMLYFWEIDRYGQLTGPGQKGTLSKKPVAGNLVVWYDANHANEIKDRIKISTIPENPMK